MKRHGAFINTRYSTDNQSPVSTSVQVADCTAWCSRHGLPVLGVYSDEAVSGMKETRPQYEAMIAALKRGEADTVVIYDQSRTFRSLTAWFDFRNKLEDMGVKVISVTQPMIGGDLRDPANFMAEATMAVFNQMWVLQTRQKVIATMKHMAKSGKHTGGTPPLGYEVRDGRLQICEEEAAVVRRIFAEYAAGYKYREIIKRLGEDGITTRNGRPFGSNSLHDLLRNEKYIGTIVYGKAPRKANGKRNTHGAAPEDLIRIEDAIPAIIDRETWERVQKKMDANKRNQAGRPATVREYPLKGKVFCGECGSAMVHSASTTQSGRYHYYACSGKQRLHNCELKAIKMGELERIVVDTVRAILSTEGNARKLIQIMREQRSKIQSGSVAQLENLISRKAEVSKQLDRATEAILNGLSSQTLINKVQELEGEKAVIEHNMAQLKRAMDAVSIPDDKIEQLAKEAAVSDDAVFAMVARVEVSKDTITIWTIFDVDPDGKLTIKEHFEESNAICIDPAVFHCDTFINIAGVAPPAPKSRMRQHSGFYFITSSPCGSRNQEIKPKWDFCRTFCRIRREKIP